MTIREGASRRVSFDTRDKLGDKIDKLTVMLGRLAAKDINEKRPFMPQISQSRGRGQNRGYSQRNYQNRLSNRSTSRDRGQLGKAAVDPDLSRVIEGKLFEIVLGDIEDKITEGSIEMIIVGAMVTIEVGIDQERDHSQETIAVTELAVQATVGQGQDPEPVLIGIE